MFVESRKVITLMGESFTITQPLSGVKALSLPYLDHEEASILLRTKNKEIASKIDALIATININNIAVEEYAARRKEFVSITDNMSNFLHSLETTTIDKDSHQAKRFRSHLKDLAVSVSEMTERTRDALHDSKSVIADFNSLVHEEEIFSELEIPFSEETDELLKSGARGALVE